MEPRSPNQPPKAMVSGTAVVIVGCPPLAARAAAYLFGAGLALGIARVFHDPGMTSPFPEIFASVFFSAIAWAVFSSVRKARNWVRWIIVALGLLCLVDLAGQFEDNPDQLIRVLHLAQNILVAGAACLLLLPSSRRWFTKRTDA
jgi:uncharacterized protein involved in response to NO